MAHWIPREKDKDGKETTKGTEKKVKRADGKWELEVTVCNPTANDVGDVLVTEHPWAKDDGKIGDHPEAKFIALKAGECKEVTFGPYDKEPGTAYTDVYEKVGLELKWRDGTVSALAWLSIPRREGRGTALAFVTPLPHPWRAALAIGRPLAFFIKGVTGLPPGWGVSFIRPAIGEVVTLDPDVKHWPVLVELVSRSPVPEGSYFSLDIEVGMAGYPADDFHTLHLTASLARDTTAPSISVTEGARGAEGGVEVVVTAADAVTGVARPVIRYSTDGGRRWAMELLEAISEESRGATVVSGVYRTVLATHPGALVSYVIEVADGVGNVAESALGFASRLTDAAAAEPAIPLPVAEEAFEVRIPPDQPAGDGPPPEG